MANNIIFIWDASRTFWVDFERYVGSTFFAGPGNPALLPEVLKCSGTDLDPPSSYSRVVEG
jgi:hypothetical protein